MIVDLRDGTVETTGIRAAMKNKHGHLWWKYFTIDICYVDEPDDFYEVKYRTENERDAMYLTLRNAMR